MIQCHDQQKQYKQERMSEEILYMVKRISTIEAARRVLGRRGVVKPLVDPQRAVVP